MIDGITVGWMLWWALVIGLGLYAKFGPTDHPATSEQICGKWKGDTAMPLGF